MSFFFLFLTASSQMDTSWGKAALWCAPVMRCPSLSWPECADGCEALLLFLWRFGVHMHVRFFFFFWWNNKSLLFVMSVFCLFGITIEICVTYGIIFPFKKKLKMVLNNSPCLDLISPSSSHTHYPLKFTTFQFRQRLGLRHGLHSCLSRFLWVSHSAPETAFSIVP